MLAHKKLRREPGFSLSSIVAGLYNNADAPQECQDYKPYHASGKQEQVSRMNDE
jgi:hypothetical protein